MNVREIEVVSHQRPRGAPDAVHQLVEELDGEKDEQRRRGQADVTYVTLQCLVPLHFRI